MKRENDSGTSFTKLLRNLVRSCCMLKYEDRHLPVRKSRICSREGPLVALFYELRNCRHRFRYRKEVQGAF